MDAKPRRLRLFRQASTWCCLILLPLLSPAVTLKTAGQAVQEMPAAKSVPESIPAAEFARLVQDMSESNGYFSSDVFISNEISYLAIVEKLRELGAAGGAYIGVGPEQNFTYIAKVRPQIAFIVDIRRQAVIQHLMYKAIFQMSDDRARFLSCLLSKPPAGDKPPGREATAQQLTEYYAAIPASTEAYGANLARIAKTIREDFRFPLSERDQSSLEYVYGAFRTEGLQISSRAGSAGGRYPSRRFPVLRDIIEQTDPAGRPGNFLASEQDYVFVRDLQRRNRVIPLVGDFAGSKTLKAVGAYLSKNSYSVTAFYTSNVEQYLFQNGVFAAFAGNVKALPIAPDSLFIRAVMRQPPAVQVPGGRSATLLQKIAVFLKDFDDGIYTDYYRLVSTHFIAGQNQ
jgi:hypothetical protein